MSQKACDWFPVGASTSWRWEWPGPSPAAGKDRSIKCPHGKELGGSPELVPADPVPPGSRAQPRRVPGARSRALSAQHGAASWQDRTQRRMRLRGEVLRACVCRSAPAPVDACEVPTLQRTARACGDQARWAAPGAQPHARGWPCGVSCLGLGAQAFT